MNGSPFDNETFQFQNNNTYNHTTLQDLTSATSKDIPKRFESWIRASFRLQQDRNKHFEHNRTCCSDINIIRAKLKSTCASLESMTGEASTQRTNWSRPSEG